MPSRRLDNMWQLSGKENRHAPALEPRTALCPPMLCPKCWRINPAQQNQDQRTDHRERLLLASVRFRSINLNST
eukprot:216319-Amphidinium_carterae.1